MNPQWKLRHLLIGLFGLMALISLSVITWHAQAVFKRLEEAAWIGQANRLGDSVLRATAEAGMERGITAVLLAAPEEATDHVHAEVRELRTRNDRLYREVQAQLARLRQEDALDTMTLVADHFSRERHTLEQSRLLVERRITGEHGLISDVEWRGMMDGYIEALANLRRAALGPRRDEDHPFTDNPITKEITYTLTEYAGRERALVGTVLAKGRPFTVAELAKAVNYQNVAGEALRKLDMVLRRIPRSRDIEAAREKLRDHYEERLGALRQHIYVTHERGEPYPVSADEWFHVATDGIDSIITLSEQLSAHALDDIELVQREARGSVVALLVAGILVLIILLGTIIHIYRRAILPLRQLERAAHTIARGDLGQPLQKYYDDELGDVASAFETMRQALQNDIEHRIEAEQRLRESEQRFRNLVETTQDWLWEVDDQGRYTYASPQVEAILGYAPEAIVGKTPFDFMPPEEAQRIGAIFSEFLTRQAPFHALENKNLHRDGRLVVLETSAVPIFDGAGHLCGYRGMDRDVTERSRTEQRLRESEARYRTIFESLQDVYFRTTLEGRFVTISPSVEALLGYPPEEVMQMSATIFYAESAERERLLQALLERGQVQDYELRVRHRNGQTIYIAMSARLVRDDQGEVHGLEGLVRDISTRKQAEEEMRKLSQVLEQTADLVVITDQRGSIEYVNKAFEDITGYRRVEVVGRPISLLKSGQQDREFYRRMWQMLAEGQVFHGMLVNRKKNGDLFYEEKTITPVRDGEGRIVHYVSTGKDMTAKRQLQAQMQQSEKLASIGQLAAGVAHEINNPVGYINSNLGSLKNYMDDLFELLATYEQAEAGIDDSVMRGQLQELRQRLDIDFLKGDIRSLVEESQEGVKRVKQIVQDLKDFSRTDTGEREWADLHKGLESTLNIVHNEIKYKAEVVREYGELPPVECVPSQINQVFMNLLVNAAHAIEERGTITLRSGTEGEAWAWVEVEDTGKGIPKENLRHIFEPFFTTKPVGKGTGLGLSLSYGIIQKHGGRIEVESEVGKGTRFRVWLPVQAQPSA